MERVLGIGGTFMRASDPAALAQWYRDCLGLDTDEYGAWQQQPTVFATFESETDYFGSRTPRAIGSSSGSRSERCQSSPRSQPDYAAGFSSWPPKPWRIADSS